MTNARKIGFFWLRMICFLLVLALALSYAVYVLTPKYDYGICSITNLYQQPENTVDVLVLGTSVAYAGVNTNVLWEEYGIAAYNLCCAEQPYWISYYYLEEALKTQQPKLILLDAKASIYQQDYTKRGRTILSTYGIRSLSTRLRAIRASVAPEDFWSFVLAFPQLHSYYSKVEAENFQLPPDNGDRGANWKGYIEVTVEEAHERPDMVWTSVKKPINERQQEYFEKILQLAAQHEIPVMLVGFPNPDYANDHMYYNSLWTVAAEYGVTGINYNNPNLRFGLSYNTHFADWQHLNVNGSVNFSRRLAEDIKAEFELPDRRGDTAFASYQACADDWYAIYPEHKPSMEETA